MICNEKKFIFIDICKTAGSSINKAFSKLYRCVGKHHTITNIAGDYFFCTNLTQYQIDNYFKFTIVRNPYDRIVSLWLWGKTKGIYSSDFRKFLDDKRDSFGFIRFIPMVNWLRNEQGDMTVDYIGRFENLSQSVSEICEKIGVPTIQLEKFNVAVGRKHYTEYYDQETKEIVNNLYSQDFSTFGYDSINYNGKLQH